MRAQYLEEDRRTNRIDDSLQLFTEICSNKVLKDLHLVYAVPPARHGAALTPRAGCS